MLKLFLSLLAMHFFFLSPFVTGQAIAVEKSSEKTPSPELNENPSEANDSKTASFLQLMIYQRLFEGTKEHKRKGTSKPFLGESTDANNKFQIKRARKFLRKRNKHVPGGCRKVPLYVDVSQLGLSDTLISPAGFAAYQCKGKCDLKQPHKFNNHSLVKALLNSKNKGNTTDGTEPCCVPVSFRPMSFLYMSDKGVVLRTFNDVVVAECGCR